MSKNNLSVQNADKMLKASAAPVGLFKAPFELTFSGPILEGDSELKFLTHRILQTPG